MKTIHINLTDENSVFTNLVNDLGGNLSHENGETQLTIDKKLGAGTIKGISLENNKTYLEFDLVPADDIEISIESNNKDSINFLYCSDGDLTHTFQDSKKSQTIEAYQTTIISNITSTRNTIKFTGGEHVKTTVISVKTANAVDSISQKLRNTFITDRNDDFFYCGSYNIKILDALQQIEGVKNNGVVRSLFLNGFVNIVLALELEQHNKDLASAESLDTNLTKSELEMIEQMSTYINNYYDSNLQVSHLQKKSGLTAVKLQEGFKLMHGQTICEFVKTVRLKKAEDFIMNTDMNISEIVYSLGFSSRSYFSKIFKEKFGVSPTVFKKRNKQVVLTA